MSDRDPNHPPDAEPLDPELRALFDADRALDVMPTDASARLWSKLEAGLPSGGGGSPTSGGTGAPATAATGGSALLTHALALLIGAAGGAALHASLPSAPVVVEHGAPRVSLTVAAPPSVAEIVPSETPIAVPPPPPSTVTRVAHPSQPRSAEIADVVAAPAATEIPSTLAAERVGLEIARTAIARGAFDSALDTLDAHERAYPRSRVAEEREVLFIRALDGAGRHADATSRAAAFRERYPQSLFSPAIAGI